MPSIVHPILGEITIIRSARSRRIAINVRPSGEVRLTIPNEQNESEALAFLSQKSKWIEQAKERLQKRHPHVVIDPTFATRSHTLRLDPASTLSIKASVSNCIIKITYPAHMHYTDTAVQEIIKKGIEAAYRIEAAAYLPERVAMWSEQLNMKCGVVTIRNPRTRWGSCSGNNNISLNIHLMQLPDHLIDYVIIHELCHTKHKNHGPNFHKLMDKLTQGREKELSSELKNYTTR